MGEIFIGIGIGVVGLALLFMGYRFARVLLSVWGLIAGFMLGASFISDAMSSAFLGTLFGIVVGVVLGLLFAVLIYAYYYAAIVLLGASVGYWLGASFIGLFGIDPGFLSAVVGIVTGALFGLAAIVLNFPKVFLIAMTSYGGAMLIITAVMLVFDVIPNEYLSYSTVAATVSNSLFWWLSALALGTVGLGIQLAVEREVEIQQWNMMADASKPAQAKDQKSA